MIFCVDEIERGQGIGKQLFNFIISYGKEISATCIEFGGTVIKYHRTIEDYFKGLQKAGFIIECLRESKPREENFHNLETYKRRMKIPLFLFIKGKKI
jgi:GNAT superfamily N-acetyltransferase